MILPFLPSAQFALGPVMRPSFSCKPGQADFHPSKLGSSPEEESSAAGISSPWRGLRRGKKAAIPSRGDNFITGGMAQRQHV